MAYEAKVYNVMIASPGDLTIEREICRDVIHEWNDTFSAELRVVLLPSMWEHQTSPVLGDRPQGIVNKQLLENADIVVAMFWTRLGTHTGEAESGTAEEIEKHHSAGKPTMVYFSSAPVKIESVDPSQYDRLLKYKASLQQMGLLETFESPDDFQRKFRRQLSQTLMRHNYTASSNSTPKEAIEDVLPMSSKARAILVETAADDDGMLLMVRHLGGIEIRTNDHDFCNAENRKDHKLWAAAVTELMDGGYIKKAGDKFVYRITTQGYRGASMLRLQGMQPAS